MRINKGQEFVIGGYTIGGHGFDALIFGYYDKDGLRFAAKTRNGFTPASRNALIKKMTPLLTTECPFLGLPEKRAGRWGQGITAEKMKDCRWLRPELVGHFEFSSLETVFEVTVNGRVHKVPGTKLQRWIHKRREEWKGPRGLLFKQRPTLGP
jgi:ATP-dependent DNA ligase